MRIPQVPGPFFAPCTAGLYDALAAEGVTIRACVPVGLVSNLAEGALDYLLVPHRLPQKAEALHCAQERLHLEAERTGAMPEAFAKILEEKVRGGMFNFSDLLVSYSIGEHVGLLISPTAEHAAITMLESKR